MTTRLYASAFRMRDTEGCMRLAFADCLRCGEPAFPTRGYCSRQCEECDEWDDGPDIGFVEVWSAPDEPLYVWAELRCTKPAYTCKIVSLTDPEDE